MSRLVVKASLLRPDFALEIDDSLLLEGITGMLGANGAGKTTLLRIIAGLEYCPEAEVVFRGEVWQRKGNRVPPHRRRIGYVFQDGRLFPHLSVEGNLRFALGRAAASRMRWSQVIDAFDLTDLLERQPATLSGGERQRVAIARALLADPMLMLMDEPLSSVDRQRKFDLMPYIERLPEEFGLPVLYVTHQQDELVRLASQLILMDHGRIITRGPIAAVLERVDLATALITDDRGTLLEGVVESSTEAITRVRVDRHELRLPALSVPDGARIRLRIQAREISLAIVPPQGLSIRNIVPARILGLEQETEPHQVDVLLDLGDQHLRARVTTDAVSELGLYPGQEVYALIKSVAFETHYRTDAKAAAAP